MQHYWSLDDVSLENVWLTVGSFDGVHRGHQAILGHLIAGASLKGVPAVVLTFHPHPAVVLRDRKGPYYLTLPEQRAALMGDLGIDYVVTHPFSREIADFSAEDFVKLLVDRLKIQHLLIGYDFALGRDRKGDAKSLTMMGRKFGFSVELFHPVRQSQEIISSSNIRAALKEGDIRKANRMLGRVFDLSGIVEHGDGRGQSIGIPTANLAFSQELLTPNAGVYASKVSVGDRTYAAVTNIGYRPTFYDQPASVHVEAHILDFQGDLYQKEIRIFFFERLRGEQRFASAADLVSQIKKDIQVTRDLLKEV